MVLRFPAEVRYFSIPKIVLMALGPTHLPIQWVTEALSTGIKSGGAVRKPLWSVEVTNEWSCTSTSPYTFMECIGTTFNVTWLFPFHDSFDPTKSDIPKSLLSKSLVRDSRLCQRCCWILRSSGMLRRLDYYSVTFKRIVLLSSAGSGGPIRWRLLNTKLTRSLEILLTIYPIPQTIWVFKP